MSALSMMTRGADGLLRVKTMDEIMDDKLREQQGGLPAMPKEEADSLLGKIAGAGLGALHYVGSTLDKTFGGRSVRGLLGGKPRELLAPLPFSDTLGITDPEDIVSGRDLLEQGGVLQKKAEGAGFQWDDLAGIATEMALDPSMYVTGPGKALTRLGQKAEKAVAGVIPTRWSKRIAGLAPGSSEAAEVAAATGLPVAKVANQPLGGLVGVGLPFMDPSFTLGTGKYSQAAAEYIGKQADKLTYSPVGTAIGRLFDPAAGNYATAGAQAASRAGESGRAAAHAGVLREFTEVGKPLGAAGIFDRGDELRDVLENVYKGAAPAHPENLAAAARLQAMNQRALDEGLDVGRHMPARKDYATRQLVPPDVDTPGFSGGYRKSADVTTAMQKGRLDVLNDVPGETGTLNRMSVDQALRKELDAGNKLSAEAMLREHMGMDAAAEAEYKLRRVSTDPSTAVIKQPGYQPRPNRWYTPETLPNGQPNPKYLQVKEWERIEGKAKDLRGFYENLDPSYAANQVPMFGNHPLTDAATYHIQHQRAQSGAKITHDALASAAGTALPGEKTVTAREALKAVGLDAEVMTMGGGPKGGPAYLLKQLIDKKKVTLGQTGTGVLDSIHIPADLVDDLARAHQVVSTPESLKGIVGVFDSVTNLTKAMQTSPFPSFGARNLLTGVWQNVAGLGLSPGRTWQSYADSLAMKANQTVKGAAERYFKGQGLSDAEATLKLHENLFEHSARTGLSGTLVGETLGKSTAKTPRVPQLPGTGGETSLGTVASGGTLGPEGWFGGSAKKWLPWNVRGTGGEANALDPLSALTGPLSGGALKGETTMPYFKYMEDLNHSLDDTNRMAGALGLMAEGYNPATAAAKSKGAHYDYSRLTDFEREVGRRVIPFYNWSRQNIPYQLAQVLNHPGGMTAQAIKAGDSVRSNATFVPPSAAAGTAIPIGAETPEGTQRFLTNLGLPFEDAFSMIGTGPDAAVSTMEKMAGMTNPLIKAPLEMLAGKQMYSGRQLDDLYSRTGLGVTADQVLMNSPASRAITTIGQIADPRKDLLTKALMLAGPAKVTDVDADKARAALGKEVLAKTLDVNKGVSSFQKLYVRPENMGMLSPEEQRLYQLYQYLDKEARRAADARRKAGVP